MKHLSATGRTRKLSDSVHQHLNAYALAAGAAGVGLLAAAPRAEAKIVYTTANTPIVGEVNLDLTNNGIADFALCLSSIGFRSCHQPEERPLCGVGREALRVLPSAKENQENEIYATSQGYAAALQLGFVIGPKRTFSPGSRGMAFYTSCPPRGFHGLWQNKQDRYLGLQFIIAGKIHYGWARLSLAGLNATLTGYAYQTIPGQAIRAGQTSPDDSDAPYANSSDRGPRASATEPIPDTRQPGSLGMLALGAQGVPLWRRKEWSDSALRVPAAN